MIYSVRAYTAYRAGHNLELLHTYINLNTYIHIQTYRQTYIHSTAALVKMVNLIFFAISSVSLFSVLVRSQGQACDPGGGCTFALCEDTTQPDCFGEFFPGYCAGPANIQCCCAQWGTCNAEGKSGTCVLSMFCGGSNHPVAGVCPGDAGVQCCVPNGPAPPPPPSDRSAIIARAQSWVDDRIPYCQCNSDCCGPCPYCSSYRCDCSGYVTYALQLPPGQTTYTLPNYCHQISDGDLLPGDIILNVQEHVIMFAGWATLDHTAFMGYQESGCQSPITVASLTQIPYPLAGFAPYRMNGLDGDLTGVPRVEDLRPSHPGLSNVTGWKLN